MTFSTLLHEYLGLRDASRSARLGGSAPEQAKRFDRMTELLKLMDAMVPAQPALTPAASGDPEHLLAAVRSAITDYYAALDRREHGGVAQNRAFSEIERALGMVWVQGASRTAEQAQQQ